MSDVDGVWREAVRLGVRERRILGVLRDGGEGFTAAEIAGLLGESYAVVSKSLRHMRLIGAVRYAERDRSANTAARYWKAKG